MPQTEVVFYKEDGIVFFVDWLMAIPAKAQRKCLVYLLQLETHGHELRRPIADLLRDGIYELRPTVQGIHYRILYFYSGKDFVVVSHEITKESEVPATEIVRAIERKRKFERHPSAHLQELRDGYQAISVKSSTVRF
ncbi:MAG: type II toxin-antitoxin system RelE/ParE family toxin [Acidobacteria bacterium]|nr:type II toxin-antitoxin system RelE/ParE family toxin [Acidobacteriota bacterium]